MQTIKTESNVARRFTATFLDYFIIFFFTGIYVSAFIREDEYGAATIDNIYMIGPFLFWFFWLVIAEWKYGTTFGHWSTKLKVVTTKGERPNLFQCFLRRVLDPVEIICSLGLIAYFSVVSTARNQRLGDLISGCLVIDHKADMTNEWFDFERKST